MPVRSPLSRVIAGALDGHVGAGAHRQADVGGREGGCVVDAVAGHGDDSPFVAEPLDDVGLVVGQHLGLDPVDAEAACDGLGGDPVVTGEHDDLDAFGAERLQGGGGGLLDRVGDGEDRRDLAVDADEDDGGAVGAQPVGFWVQRGRCRVRWLVRKVALPSTDRPLLDDADDALAGGGVEVASPPGWADRLWWRRRRWPGPAGARRPFHPGRQAQQVVVVERRRRGRCG